MEVKTVTVDRRQTNDKIDTVYAIIEMEDDSVHRTAYYIFTINFYDVGGWIIDEQEKYKGTTAFPLKQPDENVANAPVGKVYNNYTLKSVNSDNLQGGYCDFTYEVDDVRPNLTYSGQVIYRSTFKRLDDSYYWESSLHEENLNTEWDVTGTWTATLRSNSQERAELTLIVESIENETIVLDGTIALPLRYGGSYNLSYYAENVTYHLSPARLSFVAKTTDGKYELAIGFYADRAGAGISNLARWEGGVSLEKMDLG